MQAIPLNTRGVECYVTIAVGAAAAVAVAAADTAEACVAVDTWGMKLLAAYRSLIKIPISIGSNSHLDHGRPPHCLSLDPTIVPIRWTLKLTTLN